MTLPLLMVLAFAGWTLLVLLIGIGVRRWLLIFAGKASLTSFPADTPHGSQAYRRAMRAHANCVENLPVFAAIVFVAALAHITPAHMDALAVAVMVARVGQSSVHMALPETNATIAVRFGFFLAQVVAMSTMAFLIASAVPWLG